MSIPHKPVRSASIEWFPENERLSGCRSRSFKNLKKSTTYIKGYRKQNRNSESKFTKKAMRCRRKVNHSLVAQKDKFFDYPQRTNVVEELDIFTADEDYLILYDQFVLEYEAFRDYL
jgi:hypothetical protein